VISSCEYGSEPLCSIKGKEFLGYLSDCQFIKRVSVPWILTK
jgi:hypothetical protein